VLPIAYDDEQQRHSLLTFQEAMITNNTQTNVQATEKERSTDCIGFT
jgi:hypothetical protein